MKGICVCVCWGIVSFFTHLKDSLIIIKEIEKGLKKRWFCIYNVQSSRCMRCFCMKCLGLQLL